MFRVGRVIGLIVIIGGCASAPPASAPLASTPSATVAPTPSPSPTPSPTPTPFASLTSTGDCSVSLDKAPAANKTVFFSGERFKPNTQLRVRFQGPGSDFVFPDAGVHSPMLTAKADGTFGPWDVTFNKNEVGDWAMTFSDATCMARVHFKVAES